STANCSPVLIKLIIMVLELFGVVFGFIYLYLEIMHKKGMWIIGLLMAAVYAVVYFQQGVYASMGFQVYYILVSIYGFFQWQRDKTGTKDILYRKIPLKILAGSALIYIAATYTMVMVLGKTTDDPVPWIDASVTVMSAIATFWLSKSYKEQWLMWLIVNALTVAMAIKLGLYPTAVLYTVNAAASVYGYFHWGKKGKLLS
ncbi:MAG: nicotinamide mononucleotide transporter, partial [Bacteroidales bacterium]|nr:nicotinamide mononucleotide transporter [Bacteroidales bacterium]